MGWTTANIPDQSGKTVIVTGANSGIGFETAKALADKNAQVILACRNIDKAEKAKAAILETIPNADLIVEPLDLSDLNSVKAFASRIIADYQQLDLLINNAGVMIPPFTKTVDDFELQFGTNHLGHFALTGLLLDRLAQTPKSRIVSLSSVAHRFGNIDFNNLNAERRYNKWLNYGQSKLANLMFAYELQRRLERNGVQTISLAAHPGATATDLGRHSPMIKFVMFITQETAEGALPTLRAATDPTASGGDFYGPKGFMYLRGEPVKETSTKRSQDEEVAERLWQVSEQMTGVHYLP